MPDEGGFTVTEEVLENVEYNIEEIGIEGFDEEHLYEPEGGTAKWFRDKLGQMWVKFGVIMEYDGKLKSLVIPASKVTFVQYFKEPK